MGTTIGLRLGVEKIWLSIWKIMVISYIFDNLFSGLFVQWQIREQILHYSLMTVLFFQLQSFTKWIEKGMNRTFRGNYRKGNRCGFDGVGP